MRPLLHFTDVRYIDLQGLRSSRIVRWWFLLLPVFGVSAVLLEHGHQIVDDGYYYLQIAFNAAGGRGFTFDGIHPTNGFQPLWQILLVPVFWLTNDKYAVASLVTVIGVLFFLATGVTLTAIVRRIAGRKDLWWFPCFLWAFNPALINIVAWTGMETALLGFFLSLTVQSLYEYFTTGGSVRKTSLLLTACSLIRLDAVAALVVVLLSVLIVRKSWRPALEITGPAAAALTVYFFVNIVTFGHPAPISGHIYTMAGQERLLNFLLHGDPDFVAFLFRNISVFMTLNGRLPIPVSFVGSALGIAAIVLVLRRLVSTTRIVLLVMLSYCAVTMMLYAALYDDIGSVYRYYWLPMFITAVLLLSVGVVLISTPRVRSFVAGSLIVLQATFGGFYAYDLMIMIPNQELTRRAVDFATNHIPPGAKIAAWDAGQIGYYFPGTVVNLDGLVNSFEFLEAWEKGSLAEYIERERIQYIGNIDYPSARRRWIVENFKGEAVYEDTLRFSRYATRFSVQTQVLKSPETLSGQQSFYFYRLEARRSAPSIPPKPSDRIR